MNAESDATPSGLSELDYSRVCWRLLLDCGGRQVGFWSTLGVYDLWKAKEEGLVQKNNI